MKQFLTFSLVFIYLVAWLPIASVTKAQVTCGSGATPACLYFNPASGSISVANNNITVDVMFNTGNQDSMGADVWVQFNTTQMTFVSGTYPDGNTSTGSPVYPMKVIDPITADANGVIKMTRLINLSSNPTYTKGIGTFARLTFHPLVAIGQTIHLGFVYTAGMGGGDSSIAGTQAGADILGAAPAADLTLASGPQAGALDHVTITPTSANIPTNGTQVFSAVAYDANNIAISSGVTYAWAETGNGSVNPTSGSSTTYTAGATAETATVTVTATQTGGTGTITKTANATVVVGGVQTGTLDHVTVTPASANIPFSGTQVFSATAYDANNNILASGVTYAWAESGNGSVNPTSGSSTTYTATATAETATVVVTATQTSGTGTITKTATATFTVGNFNPGPTPGAGPYITAISPSSGQKDATPQVTIVGGNFGTYDSATSKVYFGMNEAVVLDWSSNRIVVRVPAAPDITSRLTVTVRVVTSDSKTAERLGYTYTMTGGTLPSNGPETYTWIGLLMAAFGMAGLAYMKLTNKKVAVSQPVQFS